MYLASLASDPSAIDPIMDDVRVITSFLNPGELPHQRDIAKLATVYFRLEEYLTQREPLRAFTKDDLRQKVISRFQLGTPSIELYWQQASQDGGTELQERPLSPETTGRIQYIRRLGKRLMWGALILGVVGLIIPSAVTSQYPLSNNVNMAISLASNFLLFGAAWLFLKGLAGFKAELKTIYRLLCAAMILLALAQLQQVIYSYFGFWSLQFIRQGGIVIGFVPATILIYIAMHKFARLLEIKTDTSSVLTMLGVGIVAAVVAGVLPIPSIRPAVVLHVSLPPTVLLTTMITFASLIALAIKRVVAPTYTRAMAWLFLGLASAIPISVISIINLIFLAPGSAFLAYGGGTVLFIGTGICLMRSAVAFNLITQD